MAIVTQWYVDQLTKWGCSPEQIPIHDSCAMMALLYPNLFSDPKQIYVDVETTGDRTHGTSIPGKPMIYPNMFHWFFSTFFARLERSLQKPRHLPSQC